MLVRNAAVQVGGNIAVNRGAIAQRVTVKADNNANVCAEAQLNRKGGIFTLKKSRNDETARANSCANITPRLLVGNVQDLLEVHSRFHQVLKRRNDMATSNGIERSSYRTVFDTHGGSVGCQPRNAKRRVASDPVYVPERL